MELRDESEVDTWRGVAEEVRFCYGERLLQVVVAFREGCRDLLVRGVFAFSRPLERGLWVFFWFFFVERIPGSVGCYGGRQRRVPERELGRVF